MVFSLAFAKPSFKMMCASSLVAVFHRLLFSAIVDPDGTIDLVKGRVVFNPVASTAAVEFVLSTQVGVKLGVLHAEELNSTADASVVLIRRISRID